MDDPCLLIVESEILIRQPLADYLRDCGYKVIETRDAAEARAFLASGHVAVNIVLAEIDASNDSGFVLAQWIRQAHPAVKVLLAGTVARATEQAGDLCEEGPALAKPYDHGLVLERIRSLQEARDRAAGTG